MHLDLVIVEPASKAAHRAFALLSPTYHERRPRPEAHRVRVEQTRHHPGEGLEMTTIEPIGVLAQYPNQRIIEGRRVLHGYAPHDVHYM
jgi:hypothetical protein